MPDPILSAAALHGLFARWLARGWLRALDVRFAEWLERKAPAAHPLLLFLAALVSHQLGRGHSCLDLEALWRDPETVLGLPLDGARSEAEADGPAHWLAGYSLADALAALAHADLVGAGEGGSPLVRCGSRLYLRRYWRHERTVARAIASRVAHAEPGGPETLVREVLDTLFPHAQAIDWQKLACALALRHRFALITGGPGTGKTTTVVRLLVLLQALSLAAPAPRPLRIGLAAPTGKAAARLALAIARAVDDLPRAGPLNDARVYAAVPRQALTLHRLLGYRADAAEFRHHAGRPLAFDVLVIDEASMVDLELMAALLDALPKHARLILLGDKDQLASVEAGALLGELAQRAEAGHYRPELAHWLERVCGMRPPETCIDAAGQPLDQAVVMLRVSRRFGEKSAIGCLARAVNAGDAQAAEHILLARNEEVQWHAGAAEAANARLRAAVLADEGDWPGYRAYLQCMRAHRPGQTADQAQFSAWARAVLEAHARFQVLCALRQGAWGVAGLNARIAEWLHAAGLIEACEGWYAGRPVMVTRNEYALGLMNGDIGLALPFPESSGWGLRVAFPAEEGGVRWLRPARLTHVETVYALTVHKSQGSEFDHVALVLPEAMGPLLGRELIYTGITRARARLSVIAPGGMDVLRAAIERVMPRASGLRHALEAELA